MQRGRLEAPRRAGGRSPSPAERSRSRGAEGGGAGARKPAVPRQVIPPKTVTPKKEPPTVVFHMLSCPRCSAMCRYLTQLGIPHQYIDLDKLSDKGKNEMWATVRKSPRYKEGVSMQVPFVTSRGKAWFLMSHPGHPTFEETAREIFENLTPEQRKEAEQRAQGTAAPS